VSDQVIAAVIALLAAFVYVSGLALQQQGNLRAIAAGHERTIDVLRQPLWWLGVAVMCTGFVVHGFSLAIGSLTVVQPVQVAQIAFAVVLDAWIRKARIVRRDIEGAGLVVLGLIAFMLVTRPTAGADFASAGSWEWIFVAGAVIVAMLSLAAWKYPAGRAVLLGITAGVIWGIQGALLKETSELFERGIADALTSWPTYATALLGLFGLIAQNGALRAGRLAVAASLITVTNPVVSSIIGVTAFEEDLRTGAGYTAAAVACAIAVAWGVSLLARRQAELESTAAT
jgi:drug/metabolite transporter (DMT)-like permease